MAVPPKRIYSRGPGGGDGRVREHLISMDYLEALIQLVSFKNNGFSELQLRFQVFHYLKRKVYMTWRRLGYQSAYWREGIIPS